MTNEDFASLSLGELQSKTGIHASRWSRYFARKVTMAEKTLEVAAVGLGITTAQLLEAINFRRSIPSKRGRPRKNS